MSDDMAVALLFYCRKGFFFCFRHKAEFFVMWHSRDTANPVGFAEKNKEVFHMVFASWWEVRKMCSYLPKM